jgi:hypothetical protein
VSEANSLFAWKGYSIKYDSIRKTKLYQQLKEKYGDDTDVSD